MNPDTIGYVWTGKFLYLERKSCGFKNIRIRVDGALEYFHEFIMLHKVVLTFKSVDEIPVCDYSNESY